MKNTPCFMFTLFVCAVAHGQAPEPWALPDPMVLMESSNALCADQVKSTLVVGALREQGRSKAEVLALLPQSPKGMELRVVSAMRENVEDAFDFPEISVDSQFSYRSEACFRETLGGLRAPRLAALRSQVDKCQALHGAGKSQALFKCIEAVVRSAEPQR